MIRHDYDLTSSLRRGALQSAFPGSKAQKSRSSVRWWLVLVTSILSYAPTSKNSSSSIDTAVVGVAVGEGMVNETGEDSGNHFEDDSVPTDSCGD
nr:hypothetical protein [Tanacetum cinerariifolium]